MNTVKALLISALVVGLAGGSLAAEPYDVKTTSALKTKVQAAVDVGWGEFPNGSYTALFKYYPLSKVLPTDSWKATFSQGLVGWDRILENYHEVEKEISLTFIRKEDLNNYKKNEMDQEIASLPQPLQNRAKNYLNDAIKIGSDMSTTNQPRATLWGYMKVRAGDYFHFVPVGLGVNGNYSLLLRIWQ